MMQKVELLAPAGNLNKLKMAILYGADAVYIGGKNFGLRAKSDNFSIEDIKEGIEYCHSRGKKVYLTLNSIIHNEEIESLKTYMQKISTLDLDALIISDPGVFSMARKILPNTEIHISTQANNTNYKSVEFWANQGASRVILARELSLKEIYDIHQKCSKKVQLEIFVHGAMCISYSGRCLLSNYMANRDSNRGNCAQACRWNYHLVEESRPGEYMQVFEDEKGTYVFNSKDLCMLPYLPQIIESGPISIKIEGRMKSSYYVATIVKAYRTALDNYYKDPENYCFDNSLLDEVFKVSYRDYTTGFYFNKPTGDDSIFGTSSYIRNYDFIGIVLDYDKSTKKAKIEQRNKVFEGEEIEVVPTNQPFFTQKITHMENEDGEKIQTAQHPQMIFYIEMEQDITAFSMIRKKCSN